jgi:hypothetical protein
MWTKQLAVSSGMPSEAMQAPDRQAVHGLIRVGVALWQTENGWAMLQRLLQEFRTTAPSETKLPPVEAEEGQG